MNQLDTTMIYWSIRSAQFLFVCLFVCLFFWPCIFNNEDKKLTNKMHKLIPDSLLLINHSNMFRPLNRSHHQWLCNSQGFRTPWWWLRLRGRNMFEWFISNKLSRINLCILLVYFLSSDQHVSGNILPIIRSIRLRYLQHMVSCCCSGQGDGERQRGTMCTVRR